MAGISEIQSELNSEAVTLMQEKGVTLSSSAIAEWKIWTYIMAMAVKLIEIIINAFTADILLKIKNTRVGTMVWYSEEAKKFEYGNSLILLGDGSLGYLVSDTDLQIIANASVTENTETGDVYLKVCKEDESQTLVKLNDAELLAFKNYINDIKTAGIKLNVISYDADMIKYTLVVYYNLGYDPVTLKSAVLGALENYRNNLDFNGTVYRDRLIQAILDVPGVVTVSVSLLQSRAYNTSYADMGVKTEMASGYFNFAAEDGTAPDISVLTMTPIDQLT
jgi:hypothetical protein